MRRLLRHGVRFATPLGRVVWLPISSRRGRILFVIGRAVARKSTDRNRLKRRLDAAVLDNRGNGHPTVDAAVLVSPSLATAPPRVLTLLVGDLLRRLQALSRVR